ncbi:MAG: DNA helicase RecQ [Planctomycetia bacterium]|nr:DNA helicase RecQ [Planctomycetia bacterium]
MEDIRGILRQYWGFDEFRPLQAEAMACVIGGRDSVVVLPTGGGKSLCFQAPAMHMPGMAVVVSPLISLMKDQVDALADCGVPAACVTSMSTLNERQRAAREARAGKLKLLYLSPERLMTESTLDFLREVRLSFVAIDEAHCISEWGHDFRPEYRMLRRLKETFPAIGVHAYTATATAHVRDDIARELALREPEFLVGSFDRPNLVYRVQRRADRMRQIVEVIERHRDRAGIIYCIRRADVEQICASLQELGYKALPYHAGMPDEDRKRNQDAFANDETAIIVATVAFGMGIDKSDVRYVIHAGAPKSLENYQQESGRAGRDGLEAECWLLYSDADFVTWRRLQSELSPEAAKVAQAVLAGIADFCNSAVCRHRTIIRYFGQELPDPYCNACDVCLAEVDLVDDALIVGQKILSCVLRVQERFGADYTAQVLTGSREQRILDNGHDRLSTWGLLAEPGKKAVRDWVEQLVSQQFLRKTGEYNLLSVTPTGRQLLRGEIVPKLTKPAERGRQVSRFERESWEGVDRGLFERLRAWRRGRADARGLPPFMLFSDATLRDLARRRPSTDEGLLLVHGIGSRKSAEYGAEVLGEIAAYCRDTGAAMDVEVAPPSRDAQPRRERARDPARSAARTQAYRMFAEGKAIDEVAAAVDRSRRTTIQYLVEHIEREGIADPSPWIDTSTFERIATAARERGIDRVKPIYLALNEQVDYDQIWIAIACLRVKSSR